MLDPLCHDRKWLPEVLIIIDMLFMTAMVSVVNVYHVFTAGIPVVVGLLHSQPQMSTSW